MSLFFHSHCSEDQYELHINILEMMGIRLVLKKAIKYIHHLCYDLDRQYNSGILYQQTRRNTFFQPTRRGMENPPLVPGIGYGVQSSSYPSKFNILADRLSRLDRPFKTEYQAGSECHFPNAQYPNVDLFAT